MLGEMGASNVAAGWGGSAEHMEVSLEAVYAADPDLILIQCHTGLDDAKALVARLYGEHPVWQSLRAVREGRVYYLDKALFHNKPNSRFSEAYAVLKEYLYPNG
jgi:ABC-type Fe3+-hydroxamate transport system substrate-binding protein